MTIAEREDAHLIVLARALGISVGALVWAGWKEAEDRAWIIPVLPLLVGVPYVRKTAA